MLKTLWDNHHPWWLAGFCPSTVFRSILVKHLHMGVSKNRGTPKWMVKIMENPIQMDDLEGTKIFGNIHICFDLPSPWRSPHRPRCHWSHSEMARVPEGSKMRLGLARAFRKKKPRIFVKISSICPHLGVSVNGGTPKRMVKIMENPIRMDDLGVPLFSSTPHISTLVIVTRSLKFGISPYLVGKYIFYPGSKSLPRISQGWIFSLPGRILVIRRAFCLKKNWFFGTTAVIVM